MLIQINTSLSGFTKAPTVQNMNFLQFPAGLVTFTEEILNGKLHFCAVARVPCTLIHVLCPESHCNA